MTELTNVQATVPITVTVDLQELLTANVGEIPQYTGDPDDEYEPPTPMVGAIVGSVAHLMAQQLKHDATGYSGMTALIRSRIETKIDEIVTAQLDREFKPVDSYGEILRSAEPTTLREQIKKQATDAFANGFALSDRYGSDKAGRGSLKKYIDTEIDRVIKTELAQAVKDAKAAVVDKVKANAAQVITDTITRGAR